MPIASAVVDLLCGPASAAGVGAELAAVAELDVPEHVHVEAISALRGLLRRGDVAPERAGRAVDLLLALRVLRHPVAPLARDVWALRDVLTAYDAAYLALARTLDAVS